MAPKKDVVSFDDIIQAGKLTIGSPILIFTTDIVQGREQREKQKLADDLLGQGRREKQRLADEILGQGRRASTQSNGSRTPVAGRSLASRAGITKAWAKL